MEYKLNGKVSLDDYIQFNKNHQKHGFLLTRRLVLYPMLIIILVTATIPDIDFLKNIFRISPLELLEIFSPLILAIIFLIFISTIGMRLIYKRHYNANKFLQQSQDIIINERCIQITTETSNCTLTKENINKIYYDKDSIYIYSGLNIGHIVKKRFLKNENDFEELVKFVKANFEKR
jgi:hypothetical protein